MTTIPPEFQSSLVVGSLATKNSEVIQRENVIGTTWVADLWGCSYGQVLAAV